MPPSHKHSAFVGFKGNIYFPNAIGLLLLRRRTLQAPLMSYLFFSWKRPSWVAIATNWFPCISFHLYLCGDKQWLNWPDAIPANPLVGLQFLDFPGIIFSNLDPRIFVSSGFLLIFLQTLIQAVASNCIISFIITFWFFCPCQIHRDSSSFLLLDLLAVTQ